MPIGGREGSSMTIKVDSFENQQQLEVVVNGPDGATRLFICTGTAKAAMQLNAGPEFAQRLADTWTFLVGPTLTRLQFQRAVGTASLANFRVRYTAPAGGFDASWELVSVDADWDDESGRVQVRAEVSLVAIQATVLVSSLGYHVSILAAL